MSSMKLVKPSGEAERATQTTLETMEVTPKSVGAWKSPPFQRELKVNAKVLAQIEEIRQSGVVPGIITRGVLDGEVYKVDGQHRLYAFVQSGLPVGYADVRTHYFKTMAEMAEEYVSLNSSLVKLKPDDILKGLEEANEHLKKIRRRCAYVGYDSVRRNSEKSPVVSMSAVVRMWQAAKGDVPSTSGCSSIAACDLLDENETSMLCDFLALCFEAWRRDFEYRRLWGALNLTLCAWLYRRVVVGAHGKAPSSRSMRLTPDEFKRGLMSLSASNDYLDWLLGRNLGERDRAPAFGRIKTVLGRRYADDHRGAKLQLVQPSWATHNR